MIDGVTVLSESVRHTTDSMWFWGIVVVIVIILALSAVDFGELEFEGFAAMLAFCGVLIIIAFCIWKATSYEYTEYKVTVSDTVGFNEFNDRYSVVSRDGNIFTIKERSDDD